ncbi:MAG: DUF924 domain-containing protein [Rhizobacter sp.]|nr:DUF924 domain-containing protein [Rhizobacter sp.]
MTPIDRDAQAVLDFWFGAEGSAAHGHQRKEWFAKDSAFDAQIAQQFGSVVNTALAGGLQHWVAHTAGRLARIIVADQFTRNVFRDTPRAFAGDALALADARKMVDSGFDQQLPPLQRAFAYLPFEHDEDLASQDRSVTLFRALAQQDATLAPMLDYAQRHHAVIARFGRFPHRNAILSRPSSDEELAFLKQPGSRF